MKKSFLLSSLCAAALLTACSTDEPIVNGDNISDGDARYLSVNIVAANGATRADADPAKNDNYENGSDKENEVSKVRFYFFDASGKAVNVKANSTANYYDWVAGSNEDFGTGVDDPNVERILNAVVVISTKEGDALPSQMVAIVNPREALGEGSYTLEQLRTVVADYATYANGGTISDDTESGTKVGPNHFPMYNSVYAQDGEVIKATKITPDNYKTSSDEAIDNPVEIYVERNVAKVRVSIALNDDFEMTESGLIKLQAYDEKTKTASDITLPFTDAAGTTTNKQVYLKLSGWDVTADLNHATLSKRINKDWKDADLGFVWNYPTFFRSYWAEPSKTATCRYGNYDDIEKPYYNLDKNKGFTYCNENTLTALPTSADKYFNKQNTKVILAGTLCDADGKALTICEYYGIKFVDDKNQTALKKQVLNYLTTTTTYYKQYRDGANTVVEKIAPEDITFKYAKSEDAEDSYYVIPVLTESAKNHNKYQWFTSETASEDTEINAEEIDGLLRASQHAKIWNTGKTYYFADIKHFGNMTGVVRNHVYEMNIKSIYGLGTPVWDPSRRIIPETTNDEDTYIAARINILSWRIVSNDVNLKW